MGDLHRFVGRQSAMPPCRAARLQTANLHRHNIFTQQSQNPLQRAWVFQIKSAPAHGFAEGHPQNNPRDDLSEHLGGRTPCFNDLGQQEFSPLVLTALAILQGQARLFSKTQGRGCRIAVGIKSHRGRWPLDFQVAIGLPHIQSRQHQGHPARRCHQPQTRRLQVGLVQFGPEKPLQILQCPGNEPGGNLFTADFQQEGQLRTRVLVCCCLFRAHSAAFSLSRG